MRMRAQHMPYPGRQTRPGLVVAVIMLVAVIVIMPGVMAVIMRMAHNAQDARKTLLQHLNHSSHGVPATCSRRITRQYRS